MRKQLPPMRLPRRRPRRYWVDGNLYLIRDVWYWTPNGWRQIRPYERCQYAVRNPNGSKRWVSCHEGVDFSQIEPYKCRRAR